MLRETAPPILRSSILILDDDVVMLRFLREYLQHDFNIRIFRRGREALGWLQAGNQVDAMLVDLNMPEFTGFAFLEEVMGRSKFRSTPVIILSGSNRSEDRIRTLRGGAIDFITKPFNPEELRTRLELRIRDRMSQTARSRTLPDPSQPVFSRNSLQFVEEQERLAEI